MDWAQLMVLARSLISGMAIRWRLGLESSGGLTPTRVLPGMTQITGAGHASLRVASAHASLGFLTAWRQASPLARIPRGPGEAWYALVFEITECQCHRIKQKCSLWTIVSL